LYYVAESLFFSLSLQPIEEIKSKIDPFPVPHPKVDPLASKNEQVKIIIVAAIEEVQLVLRGIQKKMDDNHSAAIVEMTKLVKSLKNSFDLLQM
jgi:hypothetical protein